MPILQSWDDIEDRIASSAVRKRILPGAGMSLVRVAIQAGTRTDRHSHDFEQFVQVITGAGALETVEGTKPFGPGSLFHFPPGTWHAAVFTADTVLVETNLEAG